MNKIKDNIEKKLFFFFLGILSTIENSLTTILYFFALITLLSAIVIALVLGVKDELFVIIMGLSIVSSALVLRAEKTKSVK